MASLGILLLESLGLLIVLGVASELLAKGSHVLESQFGSGFTGSVVLGFITMLPELIFVLITVRAAGQEVDLSVHPDGVDESYFDVALGSAVGGNILLFTIGYGMVILIAYFKHNESIKLPVTLKDDLIYLFVSTLYLLFTSLKGYFAFYDGFILFAMYFIFVIHQWFEVKKLREAGEKEDHHDHPPPTRRDWKRSMGLMVIGGLGILIAAEPFVHAIVDISHEIGVSPIILALIVSPIASELPEKISAFVLASRDLRGAETAVANFIGSKIQASTLLFGSMIMYKMILFDTDFFTAQYLVGENFIQIILAVLTTLVGVWITYDLKLHLKEGWVVIVLYGISVASAFAVIG